MREIKWKIMRKNKAGIQNSGGIEKRERERERERETK